MHRAAAEQNSIPVLSESQSQSYIPVLFLRLDIECACIAALFICSAGLSGSPRLGLIARPRDATQLMWFVWIALKEISWIH